jgi:exodeoxyribonuclease-5
MNFPPLTDDQKNADAQFTAFMADPDQQVLVLSGFPGTGKSTLVKYLVERLPETEKMIKLINPNAKNYELVLTATTNKAADNLSQITGKDVVTIQSFLGLRVEKDYQTGKTRLVKSHKSKEYTKLIFIDEAFYADAALLEFIFKGTEDCKILMIGDPDQLTSSLSGHVPVEAAGFPTVKLTNLVRQQEGGPIAELVAKLRHTVKTGEFFSFKPDGFHIQHLDRDTFDNHIVEEFTQPGWRATSSRFLSFTNKRAIAYNTAINAKRTGNAELRVGDYAVCNKYFQERGGPKIKTDAMVLITDISEPTSQWDVRGKYYTLGNGVRAFCPDNNQDKLNRLREAKQQEEYDIVERIDTSWIDLRAIFASTVDKSQGSTYEKVFIDLDDIATCTSGNRIARMLLVAVSRAKQHVYLTGDLV